MKTLLQTASTAIKRAGLLIQIRSLEINLHGQLNALAHVSCLNTRRQIIAAINHTRIHLERTREDYLATAPRRPARQWRAAA